MASNGDPTYQVLPGYLRFTCDKCCATMVLIKFSSYAINYCVSGTKKCNIRRFSFKSVKNTLANYFQSESSKPPYGHICQLGDPVLRMKAAPVDAKVLETGEFQAMLEQLKDVMRRYRMSGLAAPQVGVPLQVFAIEIQNPEEIVFSETCGSVTGFRANVPRAKEVEIKAVNPIGTTFSWKAKGWTSRIAQHEFDHLQGKLYIDKMDPSTFQCSMWKEINIHKGKLALRFYAK
ncbi:peptide deformylase, mitochondrial isoform X3 [Lasioglossum baleicum]|uniref:peptide deformylase, mitochondrial isoform X3 n=1 Tax=Lasioglossum baleicum TaxID=434251 RepID=UPI003FCD3DEC